MEIHSRDALRIIADRFKLLSNPTRLDILQHICEEEKTVSELMRVTGCKQANVSRHLGLLLRAGLVSRRTEGTHVFYRIADESLPRLCSIISENIRARSGELLAAFEDEAGAKRKVKPDGPRRPGKR